MREKLAWPIYFISIVLLALLQTSFFPQFMLTRVKPDLVLLFVISVGLLRGSREGALTGLLAGIISGVVSWTPWGPYILGYSLVGFAAGIIPEKVELDKVILPLISGMVGSLAFTIIFTLLAMLFDFIQYSPADLYKVVLFLIWNAIFCLPMYYTGKFILVPPGREVDLSSPTPGTGYTME